MMIPRPTAASAAASVMMKIAKIWPSTEPQHPRKRHQVDIHRVQNQLDGHQNDDHVAAREHADHADGEQRQAQKKIMVRPAIIIHILLLAITTAPIIATSSKNRGDLKRQHIRLE